MSSLNQNNVVCMNCGAEYYSASPYFATAEHCEKCKHRDLVVKNDKKEVEVEDH